mgnify:FL=1
MTTILTFPYERISREVVHFRDEVQGRHQAKILQLPVKAVDPFLLPMAFALAWLSLFQ